MSVFDVIKERTLQGQKQLAVLIDPDHFDSSELINLCRDAQEYQVDYIFIGGSLISKGDLEKCTEIVKRSCDIPVVIFPGNSMQIDSNADAILFLSLISGRNPDLLIGQHIISAPMIRKAGLEPIPTGYILIESGKTTTAAYMSGTLPVPSDKPDVASSIAIAGEMLGMKMIFMDAGSGAADPVSAEMIKKVKENIGVPLIVGGGIRTPQLATQALRSGADMIVIGNSLEDDPQLLRNMADAVRSVSV